MAKKKPEEKPRNEQTAAEAASATAAPQSEAEQPKPETNAEAEKLQAQLDKEHEAYLRIAAEYDNFRKRSVKERDALYTDIKAETVGKFLPVYDNLERALQNETADEAYKKGVELTMKELQKILAALGVETFGEKGDTFDPNSHNAVMHIDDDKLDENVIAEVFQKGVRIGEKVVRFAMVKVAN